MASILASRGRWRALPHVQVPAAGFFSHADDRESCAVQKRSARSSMSFPAMN